MDRTAWIEFIKQSDTYIPADKVLETAETDVPFDPNVFWKRLNQYFLLKAIDIEPITKQIFRDAGLAESMTILDVGCGSGANSQFLLDIGAKKVTGIDMSESSLNLARELPKPEAYTPDRLEFLQHDIKQPLPFGDNHFDCVLVANGESVMFTDDVVAEYRRVLKEGGILVLIMFFPHTRYPWNRLIDVVEKYAYFLQSSSYLKETDPFVNEKGTNWDWRFHAIRSDLGMKLKTYVTEWSYPFSETLEMSMQQYFAFIRGPAFRRNIRDGRKWQHFKELYDPSSEKYWCNRPYAHIRDLYEVAWGRI